MFAAYWSPMEIIKWFCVTTFELGHWRGFAKPLHSSEDICKSAFLSSYTARSSNKIIFTLVKAWEENFFHQRTNLLIIDRKGIFFQKLNNYSIFKEPHKNFLTISQILLNNEKIV